MNSNNNPLKDIYYINIPEDFADTIGSFKLDKKIKLPIETQGIESWDSSTLTWEIIISAMLKLLAYSSDNSSNNDYYREFIKAVRPGIIQELTDSAIVKSQNKDFNLSEEIFLALKGLEPGDDRVLLNLAVFYEEKSDWHISNGEAILQSETLEEAKQLYIQLLSKDSILTDTYFNAGYFFIKIRNFDKAESCFDAFIEYSEDDEKINKAKEVLNNYTNILSNEDIFNKAYNAILDENENIAIEIMNEYLEQNESIWNALFLLGWAYRRLSKFQDAITSLEKASELNNKDLDIQNELAICYMEVGNFEKSQKSLEKALMIAPEDVKIISNLGIIQMKMGNNEMAIKYFETVLLFEPEDSIAKLYLEKLI
ncbi:MAG: tetratricopeptide repeat protein [Spirochaetaceae bacterium]